MGLVKIAALSAVFLIFLASIYEFIENNEPNGCEMTYMFEKPEYIALKLSEYVSEKFPHFKIFAYGEGPLALLYRERNPPVKGVPVLFIPGNAGSHRQVRSIASVALRMSQHRALTTMFDFYSIDFNEELIGFYGGNLHKQTEYIKECISYILSLYTKQSFMPKTVVLVGHSMGGVLARALFTLPDFDKSLVNLIITQATPHQSPILYADYLPEFYSHVNEYWRKEKESSLKHVHVVSVGGGERDVLVNYHMTRLDGLVKPNRAISVNTESIPRAWVSTDHLCAVWCKQVVLAISRALCDLTQANSNQLKSSPAVVRRVLGHHLINNTGFHSPEDTTPKSNVKLETKYEYNIVEDEQLILTDYKSKVHKYFSFKIEEHTLSEMVIISNNMWKSWIIGCSQNTDANACSNGTDLTHLQRLAPSASPRVYAHLDWTILQNFSHIVLYVHSTDSPIFLQAAVFSSPVNTVVYHAPTALDLLLDFPRSLYHHSDPVLNVSDGKSIYKVIKLPTLTSMYQAYRADVEITECDKQKGLSSFMRLHLPWAKGTDTFSNINPSVGGGNISLKLHVPLRGYAGEESSAQLHLYLQPSCQYKIDISIDFKKTISQFTRNYLVYLPSFVIANLLMVLCHQLFTVSRGMYCPSIAAAQDSYVEAWILPVATTILQYILIEDSVEQKMSSIRFPLSDGSLMETTGLLLSGLHLILYCIAFVLVRVYSHITHVLLAILGSVMRFLFHKVFTHHTIPMIGSVVWWIVLVLGIYSSWHYAGSVGYLVVYGLIIADITSSMVTFPKDDRRHSMWYLQQSLLLLTLTMFLLSLPEFVTWLKNYSNTRVLVNDPSRYPSIVIATSLMLIRFNTDYENWYLGYVNSFTPVVLSAIAILFGTINIWRLNVIIPTAFVWVASVQSLGIMLHRQKKSHQIVQEKSQTHKKMAGDGRKLLNKPHDD